MALNAYHLEQSRRIKEAISKQRPMSQEEFIAQFDRKNPNWQPPQDPDPSSKKPGTR